MRPQCTPRPLVAPPRNNIATVARHKRSTNLGLVALSGFGRGGTAVMQHPRDSIHPWIELAPGTGHAVHCCTRGNLIDSTARNGRKSPTAPLSRDAYPGMHPAATAPVNVRCSLAQQSSYQERRSKTEQVAPATKPEHRNAATHQPFDRGSSAKPS